MKKLIYSILLFTIIGCAENNNPGIVVSALEVTVAEGDVSLTLDDKGIVSQDGKAIGKIKGSEVLDMDGTRVFLLSETNIVYDVENDTVADYSDASIFINDSFLGVVKWSKSGDLETKRGDKLNIQLTPNDSKLYRTASLVLILGEHMKS